MNKVGVVHLVRARNGLEPLQDFLDSLGRFPGPIPFDLIFVFKGFKSRSECAPFRDVISKRNHAVLFVSDYGFDLGAYYKACCQLQNEYLYFLNSFSMVQDQDWLNHPFRLIEQPGIGLVGSSGSYESFLHNSLASSSSDESATNEKHCQQSSMTVFKALFFGPFPNPHIRTNAFIISRDLMLQVWQRLIFIKQHCYLFESGRNGLTRRIEKKGLNVLITGKDGKAYEQSHWHLSKTFRLGDQENLLVSDNQTRIFANSTSDQRKQLSIRSWGQFSKQ